ncbi:MAG: hypothetical protein FWD25_12845 [Clostridia bacterium]|nr:hypothetical protein [Clostridia bacterium]
MIGYLVGVLTILMLIIGYSVDAFVPRAVLVFFLLVLALCFFCIAKGAQIKRRTNRFRHYVSLVSLQNMISLDDIANSTSKPVDFIKKDLQKMIRKRYFSNAVLDLATNRIIICPSTLPVSPLARTWAVSPPEYEVFQCLGCGAKGKKQKGLVGYCDFCGSPNQ